MAQERGQGTGRSKSSGRSRGNNDRGGTNTGRSPSRAEVTAITTGTQAAPNRGMITRREGRQRTEADDAMSRALRPAMPTGDDPGLLIRTLIPGAGMGTLATAAARRAGLEVNREDPAEGRSEQATLRRRRLAAAAGDAPVTPVTGGADEDAGEGSEFIRRPRTVLGAANLRRAQLGAGAGRTFLGR